MIFKKICNKSRSWPIVDVMSHVMLIDEDQRERMLSRVKLRRLMIDSKKKTFWVL